jgi:hypothetical protein
MKSRIKILIGIIALGLIFIAGIETNAQGTSKVFELKNKGWVRAVYSAEEDMTRVEAYNLTIRDSIDKDLIESFSCHFPETNPGLYEIIRVSLGT